MGAGKPGEASPRAALPPPGPLPLGPPLLGPLSLELLPLPPVAEPLSEQRQPPVVCRHVLPPPFPLLPSAPLPLLP